MDAEDPPGGDPALTPVPKEAVLRHLAAALPVAQRLYLEQEHRNEIKPYESALAFGIAMAFLCRRYGWDPRDIFDLLDQVVPPS